MSMAKYVDYKMPWAGHSWLKSTVVELVEYDCMS